MKKMNRKYELLSSRQGLVDGLFSSMEWMEDNYDNRTIKQLTENVKNVEFIREMIDILSFDVVNVDYLSLELGFFDIYERVYISKICFNENVQQIKLFLEDQTKWPKTELKSIEVEFKSLFKTDDIEGLIFELGFAKLLFNASIITYIKHDIDVWLYQEKKPSIEIKLKVENENFRFLKIEYKGQPFL